MSRQGTSGIPLGVIDLEFGPQGNARVDLIGKVKFRSVMAA